MTRPSTRPLGHLLLCLGIACMASAGCKKAASTAAEPAQAAQAQAGTQARDSAKPEMAGANAEPIDRIRSTVKALVALPKIDKDSVEATLRVTLQPVTAQGGQRAYEANLPSGPLDKLTLDLPGPEQAQFLYLVLFARSDLELYVKDFGATLFQPGYRASVDSPSPRAQENYELTDAKGYTVTYSFAVSSKRLTAVGVSIKPKP